MSENCPIKELIEFFKAAIKDANTPLPESLSLHARECKSCQNLLCSPKHWKAFVRANDLEGRPLQVEALGHLPTHHLPLVTKPKGYRLLVAKLRLATQSAQGQHGSQGMCD